MLTAWLCTLLCDQQHINETRSASPVMDWPQCREDFREGYMAGAGGVPSGHAVAVEAPVVLLQLLKAVKRHKAVLTFLFHAQEMLTPAATAQSSAVRLMTRQKCPCRTDSCSAMQIVERYAQQQDSSISSTCTKRYLHSTANYVHCSC